PRGSEHLRGRIPGARQYRSIRSQRSIAHRRLSGTGRWYRLDGALLREHARDCGRIGAYRSGVYGNGAEVLGTFHVDRVVNGASRRRDEHVGRGGRLLLRRASVAGRRESTAQGALDGGFAASLRRYRIRWRTGGETP